MVEIGMCVTVLASYVVIHNTFISGSTTMNPELSNQKSQTMEEAHVEWAK